MKHSTSKISPAKSNNATGKTLVKTRKLPSKSVLIPVLHTTGNLSSNTYYANVQTCHLTKTPKNVRTDRKKEKEVAPGGTEALCLKSLYVTAVTGYSTRQC